MCVQCTLASSPLRYISTLLSILYRCYNFEMMKLVFHSPPLFDYCSFCCETGCVAVTDHRSISQTAVVMINNFHC